MGTYVVGDIHGCYNEWIELKNKIESMDSTAKFILVGDIVDRGPNVLRMIDWAMKNVKPGGKYQMILGNHEDMKIEWAKQYNSLSVQDFSKTQHYQKFNNDGYDFQDTLTASDVTDDYVIKIIEFFKSLPLYIDVEVEVFCRKQYYVICHASLPDMCLDENGRMIAETVDTKGIVSGFGNSVKDYIIWDRNYWGNNWEAPTIVVHGHTPTCIRDLVVRWSDPGRIDFRNKDINVDCGMCYNMSVSNLAAICLETLEEIYVKDLEDNYYTDGSRSKSNKEDMLYLIKNGVEIQKTLFDEVESSEEE